MMTKHSIGLTVSLIAASLLAGCTSDSHELGHVPGTGGLLGTGGATSASSVPASGGASGTGGTLAAGRGGGAGSTVVDAPVVGGSGAVTFDAAMGGAGGGADAPMATGGNRSGGASGAGGVGSGGTTRTGGTGGGTCPGAPLCNWCNGQSVVDSSGCVTGYRCSNGADPCKTSPCSDKAPCPSGYTCSNQLCWAPDGGTALDSRICPQLPSCNWCGGQDVVDSSGCVTGWRCANGVDPCKTAACSTSEPCSTGYTCTNQLCWPVTAGTGGAGGNSGTGGTGGSGGSGGTSVLCGGATCPEGKVCCGPAECGRCVFANSGVYCPDSCTASACGPSGGPCQTGEVCLDIVYYTGATRTGTASCVANPCGSDPLSCACAATLCQGTPTSCAQANDATKAVTCSTK